MSKLLSARRVCLLVVLASAVPLSSAEAAVRVSRGSHHHHARRHHHAKAHRGRHRAHRASAQCAQATTPVAALTLTEARAAVDCLVNRERVSRGLPSLSPSADLNRSAQAWTLEMVASGDFTHGDDVAGRISATGYQWQTAGENIATGFATPQAVVAGWMASTDHCQNILDPQYSNVGTGASAAAVTGGAWAPGTWTQDFGLPSSASPPSNDMGPANGCPY